jgi:uncharacterized OB-fold protein
VTPTPVDASLFASLDPPTLVGSQCNRCGTVAFPVQTGCAKCTGDELTPVELPDRGTLWTWTVQAFEPKPPYRMPADGFEPYGVGYVDLGNVIVESRLDGAIDEFEIGAAMRLTLLPVWTADDGEPVFTYAFAPEAVIR